jgi:competence protein ComEC
MAQIVRQRLLKVYQQYGISGDEFGILASLTLGYRDQMDEETRDAFSHAGAMHVLAVSGLHLGVIYLFFRYLFSLFLRRRGGKVIAAIITVLVLWVFAFIAGLPPSAMRAATMFSFIAMGSAFEKETSPFNSLAASAFFLLLLNPMLVTHVGFQLSYAAVTGIIFIYPRINSLWSPSFFLTRWLFQLLALSLAAQIATFPLAIHYFHIFPKYFLLTNLLVIPLTTVVLYLALLLFTVSFWGWLASVVAGLLEWILALMNGSVKWIDSLPGSLISDISLQRGEVVVVYLFIVGIYWFIVSRRQKGLLTSLLALLIFTSYSTYKKVERSRQHLLFVYAVPGITLVEFVENSEGIIVYDHQQELTLKEDIEYHIGNNHRNLRASKVWQEISDRSFTEYPSFQKLLPSLEGAGNLYHFYGRRILLLDHWYSTKELSGEKLQLDVVILTSDLKMDLGLLDDYFDIGIVVIDSSHNYWLNKERKTSLDNYGISYYSVYDSGAFVLNL